ncbi:nucleoside diphosphate kinase 5-like protein [Neocallimastix lanati (nom. inval.)]|jgi:nucleoside-diphosphate kinase|uniref:Nucleoside diphosphate kinase n=1 Tax=Neocallimastix californiae TaxID=1754190 RepID=A0A1Y2AMQ8_9FUNG|nr:nucleoside diphosphate kinase 5-like protein [Neocallimastix sp. JGI-2020a]ORY23849.1 nucleoside diphosphate kinase 5-like protein [Neocallimastix californiae]|eukprot:ORY23849.1 nucleoside diphosphate kinase 5-like protein [Neocallimastix californiae]
MEMENIIEKTLVIIKPDAIEYANQIEWAIIDAGFTILNKSRILLTDEQVFEFYKDYEENENFNKLVEYMTSGPIIVMILSKKDAVNALLECLGPSDPEVAREQNPKSLRAKYGKDAFYNGIHCSSSYEEARKEIGFFFSNAIIDPLTDREEVRQFLEKELYPVLTLGLTQLCKEKPEDPILWLGNWLLKNNPNTPIIIEADNE